MCVFPLTDYNFPLNILYYENINHWTITAIIYWLVKTESQTKDTTENSMSKCGKWIDLLM